jgi:hypothetical protein
MDITPKESDTLGLTLSRDETALLANCLNEVLHGFAVKNFEQQLSGSPKQFQVLLDKLNSTYQKTDAASSPLQLSPSDLRLLANSIAVCIAELGEEEFSTRVGFDIKVAQKYAQELPRLSENSSRAK